MAAAGPVAAGFAIMDGFDLGAALMLPFVGRHGCREARGHQHGGTGLGRQPGLADPRRRRDLPQRGLRSTRASFSASTLAMLLVLAALILRPVGFKFRSKMPGATWRSTWDWLLFVGGLVPSLVFGVAMGNLLEGVPFGFDGELRAHY